MPIVYHLILNWKDRSFHSLYIAMYITVVDFQMLTSDLPRCVIWLPGFLSLLCPIFRDAPNVDSRDLRVTSRDATFDASRRIRYVCIRILSLLSLILYLCLTCSYTLYSYICFIVLIFHPLVHRLREIVDTLFIQVVSYQIPWWFRDRCCFIHLFIVVYLH